MSKLYNVGAYVRLSVENTAYDIESESIENQKEMLSKFIGMMPGWIEEKFYVDNGYSGASFNRPAFQEMMEDVRSGRVNLVLVKDLSRFGRNYLEAGRYLEEELPSLGCRFVSLSEGIDTENGENDIMPFLNAMNDYYLKNLSDRIRVAMAAMARDGQKISGSAPYGYQRDPNEPTRLIVDEYSADVVRRIYEMRKQGNGCGQIAKVLNAEGILPPLLYYLTTNSRDDSHIKVRVWRNGVVGSILKKELYIGNAVQLVKQVASYRDKREIYRPADEYVRVDNAFPAIIDRSTWEAVQSVNIHAGERYKKKREPKKQLFTGILVCPDCGAVMVCIRNTRTTRRKGTVDYNSYQCQTYSTTCGGACTSHAISESVIKDIVSDQLRQVTNAICLDENVMLNSLTKHLMGNNTVSKAERKKEQRLLHQQLYKLELLTGKLYEDRVTGVLSEESYSALARKNEAEQLEKEKRLALLEDFEQEHAAKLSDIKLWMRLLRENSNFSELTRDLLESLVDRIEVSESEVVDGIRHRDVRIVYKFVGLALVNT